MCENEESAIRESVKKWEDTTLTDSLQGTGELKKAFATDSNLPVNRVYTPLDISDFDYLSQLGMPGEYPFTRGITPTMYRSKHWTISQYAGFGSAAETNKWFKYLREQGVQQLSMALDLPTQIGIDSDNPMSHGEVGKVGAAVSSLRDFEIIFDGIPIQEVRPLAIVCNSNTPIFLAFLLALAEKRGIPPQKLYLRFQNNVLKEYIARGTQIFPPNAGVKFCNDVTEFVVKERLFTFGPLSICGYHIRDAGATAPQEMGFTLTNAMAFIDELLGRGIKVDDFAHLLWVFLGVRMDFFEEIAKFRAFRQMWAKMMKEKYGAKNPQSMAIKLVSYTIGSMFTAQEPLNNIVRGAIEGLAAAMAGQQTLSVTSYDEAFALPSAEAAKIALRTQQIIAHETGVTSTVDPLGGSYYVEALTNNMEKEANKWVKEVEDRGGAIAAIEQGYHQGELAKSAYEWEKKVNSGERVILGVNMFRSTESLKIPPRKIGPEVERDQIAKLVALRRERDNEAVRRALAGVKLAAKQNANTVYPILKAAKAYATVGEICDVLREVWGEFKPQ